MSLMLWFVYYSAAFGLAFIMGAAKISFSLRVVLGGVSEIADEKGKVLRAAIRPFIPIVGPFLVELLECFGCSGFWIGVASSFWLPQQLGSNPVAWSLIMGCSTAGLNFFLATVMHGWSSK